MSAFHTMEPATALAELGSDLKGLSQVEAARRLREDGANQLPQPLPKSFGRILLGQLRSTLVLILLIAAVVSAALGDHLEALVIAAIVVLNALLGVRQEYRAEQALALLRKYSVALVRVRREGEAARVPSTELVRGDILELETGETVPADALLLEGHNLRVDESILTGESVPVDKRNGIRLPEGTPVADRLNMVFAGTNLTYGRGLAVVTHTASETQLGRIAMLIQSLKTEPTPLQLRLDALGRILALISLVAVSLIFGVGILRGEPFKEMLITAISLAVAVVPEGLPAVVTIALALGAERILRKNALIRTLPSIETLGSVTVICSDKTGTLTENRMRVARLWVDGSEYDLEPGSLDPAALALLRAGALCNDAVFSPSNQEILGDPTEIALQKVALDAGIDLPALSKEFPRVSEVPFDSDRKRMTTVHQGSLSQGDGLPPEELAEAGFFAVAKGSVESILEVATRTRQDASIQSLDENSRTQILGEAERLAGSGLRVLGLAMRSVRSLEENPESELLFLGMIGMVDPPRAEAEAAVRTCRAAGIRPVMITGDHPRTAARIAEQVGISGPDEDPVTGIELDSRRAELGTLAMTRAVFARVTAEHKLLLIESLQSSHEVVAMTGDGVNDAPALKKADIGIAMGLTGTDVSRESSDMVLLDDNFATIVKAVEEGRVLYDNLKKFILFLLSCNLAEVWVMAAAPFLCLPLPLLPLQILWMNLLTDGLPALALAVEPAERNVMERPPNPSGASVLSPDLLRRILAIGVVLGAIALSTGWYFWQADRKSWQTVLFTSLTLGQMSVAFSVRRGGLSMSPRSMFSNPYIVVAIGLTILLQLAVVFWPPLQAIFQTTALTTRELLVCLLGSLLLFVLLEARKLLPGSRWE